jgi:deoxyribonuclease-4
LRVGIHTSTAGEPANAARKAHELGANCFQIFSSSPRTWRATPPSREQAAAFRSTRQALALAPVVVHDAYLINLASAEPEIRAKSVAAFRGELERAAALGAEYLVMHPGSAKGHPAPEAAYQAFAAALGEASRRVRTGGLTLLLENTAGAGATLGRSLAELAELRRLAQPGVEYPIAYCLDTCHLYAAGYDVATAQGLARTVREAGRVLGLDQVPVIHANDSAGALGSRLDRHAHIGAGQIGLEGFRRLVNHPKLRRKAFILETPIDNPGDDLRNVATLQSLYR